MPSQFMMPQTPWSRAASDYPSSFATLMADVAETWLILTSMPAANEKTSAPKMYFREFHLIHDQSSNLIFERTLSAPVVKDARRPPY